MKGGFPKELQRMEFGSAAFGAAEIRINWFFFFLLELTPEQLKLELIGFFFSPGINTSVLLWK